MLAMAANESPAPYLIAAFAFYILASEHVRKQIESLPTRGPIAPRC